MALQPSKDMTMRIFRYGLLALLVAGVWNPRTAEAQSIASASLTVTSGTTPCTEANATRTSLDYYVTPSCLVVQMRGRPSLGIVMDIGTSGTAQFEKSVDGVVFSSLGDDIGALTSATADGEYYFTNPGYAQIRVRMTAISGTTNLVATIGGSGLRSTATLSGGGTNPAAGATGSGVPASASFTGISVGGTHRGWTGLALGSHFAGAVAIVDGSGNQVTSFGGAGGGGAAQADNTALANITGMGALYDTTPPAVTDGLVGIPVMNSARQLFVVFPSAQPVSGTVSVAGVATESTLGTRLSESVFTTRTPVLGQATMANSSPVAIASNQSAIPVTGTFWQATQPVSGTVSSNLLFGGTAASTNDGPLTAQTLRTAIANDSEVANDIDSIRQATEATQGSMATVAAGLAPDAFHGNDPKDTGPQGMLYFMASPTAVADNKAVRQRASDKGEAYVVIRDAAGDGPGANVTTEGLAVDLPAAVDTQFTNILTAVQSSATDQVGASAGAVVSAASNNSTNLKASAGRLLGVYLVNTTATVYYLKFYNLAAAPTCSSATGWLFTLPIPASATSTGGGFSMNFGPTGFAMSAGVGYCITAGAANTDNVNAATGIYGVVQYK